MKFLKKCKNKCKFLFVGIHSDETVSGYKRKPIIDMMERIEIVESCKYVDSVVIFDESTPFNVINAIRPDVVVKGGDYKPDEVVGYGMCEVKIFNFIDGYSTTNIVEKIRDED